ncbi:hypothetical protein Hanom_Chr05g00471341 [Helianthus anomalus]
MNNRFIGFSDFYHSEMTLSPLLFRKSRAKHTPLRFLLNLPLSNQSIYRPYNKNHVRMLHLIEAILKSERYLYGLLYRPYKKPCSYANATSYTSCLKDPRLYATSYTGSIKGQHPHATSYTKGQYLYAASYTGHIQGQRSFATS